MPSRGWGTLTPHDLAPLLDDLRHANAALARAYPGERSARQPVHTVYGGVHLFRAGTVPKLGALGLSALNEYAPDGVTLAAAMGPGPGEPLAPGAAARIRARIVDKLHQEPVEDYRIDFEDGYGTRSDEEEDRHAPLVHRHSHQADVAGTAPAGPADARPVRHVARALDGRAAADPSSW